MNKQYPNLFSPIVIRGHRLKNRVIAAPMVAPGLYDDATGLPTEKCVDFFGSRARGGCAVVTTGETPVNREEGVGGLNLALSDTMRTGDETYKQFTYRIRSYGAIPSVQLYHAGSGGGRIGGTAFAPSGGYTRPDGVYVKEMDRADMDKVIADFVQTADNAKAAGFDMVMFHGGHGWLLTEFASPRSNHRTDEYGGCVKNRARFVRELLQAVREKVGPDMIFEYRISAEEMLDGGMTIDDTVAFIQQIDDLIDIVHLSTGSMTDREGYTENTMYPLWFKPHGVNIAFAEKMKKNVRCLVSVVGGINDPQMAEDAIAQGKADLISMNRQLVADPDWCNKALENRSEEIRPCIRCINCHDYVVSTHFGRNGAYGCFCAVNPRSIEENWLKHYPKATQSRNVVVIGGGVGGMSAAATAAELGHRVTLIEKNASLGGVLRFTDYSPIKKDISKFLDWSAARVYQSGATVLCNTEATPELVNSLNPDTVLCAIGSKPIKPRIPGIDGKHVWGALDAYRHLDTLGKHVVVVGGNLTGVEAAIDFAHLGHTVSVIEMAPQIATGAPFYYMKGIREEIDTHSDRLTFYTGMKSVSITESGVVMESVTDGHTETIPADSVIYAVGMRADSALMESFRDCGTYFRPIGDCSKVAKLKNAVEAGYHAALEIL